MNGFGYSPINRDFLKRGKNLFNVNDPNKLTSKYIKTDGTIGNGAGIVSDYISIIPLVLVWFSKNGVMDNTFTIAAYDVNKEYITGSYATTPINNGYLPPASAKYIRIAINPIRWTSVTQLEQGYGVTSFAPYGYDIEVNNFIGNWEYPLSQVLRSEIGGVVNQSCDIIADFRFAFSTDAHINSPAQIYKMKQMIELNKLDFLDVIINGGDLCVQNGEIGERIRQLYKTVDVFKDTHSDIVMCKGNHDVYSKYVAGSVDNYVIPKRVWHNLCCHHQRNKAIFDENNPLGGYYYKDYPTAKIRLVVLNTSDVIDDDGHWLGADVSIEVDRQRIQQTQFTWLCSVALDFRDKGEDASNWGLITVAHTALVGNSYGLDTQRTNLEGVLNAFMAGGTFALTTDAGTAFQLISNVDFSSQGAMEYIAHFCGNAHWDIVAYHDLGYATIPNIVTANMGNERKTTTPTDYLTEGTIFDIVTPLRGTGGMDGDGTVECELMDIVNVNRTTKTIINVRYGAGDTRIIPYKDKVDITMPATSTLSSVLTGTLTWESQDESVATVDSSGVVTGVIAGKVVITATNINGQVEGWCIEII